MAGPDEIDETLEEVGFSATEAPPGSEDTSTEAANSANIRVYIDGYSTQLTFRRTTAMGVIKAIKRVVEMAKENGWKTSWKNDESDPSVRTRPTYGSGIPATTPPPLATAPTKICRVHSIPMEHKFSKTKGKPYDVHYNEENKPCFGHGYMA